MHGLWRVFAGAVLVLLAAPPARATSVVQPTELTLAVGPGVLRTAYGPSETVLIRTAAAVTMASACSILNPSGALVGHPSGGVSTEGTFVLPSSPPVGVWTVDCGAGTPGKFQVTASPPHGRLWAMDGDSAECSSFPYQGPLCEVMDEYTVYPPSGLHRAVGAIPDVDDPTIDGTWLRENAWYWVLDDSLPKYAMGPPGSGTCSAGQAPLIPDWSDITATCSVAAVQPTAVLPRDYSRMLGQLILAYRASVIYNDVIASGDELGSNEAAYREALVYWMDALVPPGGAVSGVWADKDADLDRSHLLQASAHAYDWTHGDPNIDVETRAEWLRMLGDESQGVFQDFVDPGEYDPHSTLPTLVLEDPDWENHHRRVMLNGHTWAKYSAIGIAVIALRAEMTGAPDLRDDLDLWSSYGFGEALGYRSDGSTSSGVDYWESDSADLYRYLEAARTVDGVDYTGEPWPENNPLFLAYMTDPNGQRVMLADSDAGDFANPSWLMALGSRIYASSEHAPLTQRLAWLGHNASTAIHATNRGPLDIMWWNSDRARWSSTEVSDELYPRHCFADSGLVSVRSSWSSGATHLAYRGGPLIGGHDGGQVGDFVLYRSGHLVSSDGINSHTKRTADASTLIIDGYGQHGDALTAGEAAPESATEDNNSRLVTYLDAKGDASYKFEETYTFNGIEYTLPTHVYGSVDLVSFGTDLTQLYRYDAGDDIRYAAGMTDADGGSASLDEVRRYFVWVTDDHILQYDRIETTGFQGIRSDWNLQAFRFGQNSLPAPVAVTAGSSGRYVWNNTTASGSRQLAFYPYDTAVPADSECILAPAITTDVARRWPCIDDSAIVPTDVTGRRALYRDLNKNLWQPEPASAYTSAITGTGATRTISSSGSGKLLVKALESSAALSKYYTPGLSGNKYGGNIAGEHLSRTQSTADHVYLTALQPYTGTAPTGVAATSITDGYEVVFAPAGSMEVTLLFADGGNPYDGAGNELDGHVGVMMVGTDANASKTDYPWYAAQMMEATRLAYDSETVLQSDAPVSLSLTWGDWADFGTVTGVPTGGADISVNVREGSPLVGLLTYEDGSLEVVSLLVDSVTNLVTFTVDQDATFQIFYDDSLVFGGLPTAEALLAGTSAEPRAGSDCFGQ